MYRVHPAWAAFELIMLVAIGCEMWRAGRIKECVLPHRQMIIVKVLCLSNIHYKWLIYYLLFNVRWTYFTIFMKRTSLQIVQGIIIKKKHQCLSNLQSCLSSDITETRCTHWCHLLKANCVLVTSNQGTTFSQRRL